MILKDFVISPNSPLPGGPPQPDSPGPKPRPQKPQAPRARKCPPCNGTGVMHPRRFQVPCNVCEGTGSLSKSFRYGIPHNSAWSFLKEADLTPAQWKPDIQQNGAEQGAQGGTVGEAAQKKTPEQEMREKESDHNISVNNPATQEWFTGLLPDAIEFRRKLLSTIQSPGTAPFC